MNAAARALRNPIGWAVLLILLVLACGSVFAIVPETQQAVIVRMGVPRAVVNRYRADQPFGQTGAGLIARLPGLDHIYLIDRREQSLELEGQPLVTADGQRLSTDAVARYRIVDPARMYLATHGDRRRIADALKPALGAALQANLGRLSTAALLATDRAPALDAVTVALDRAARSYGVRVGEVRLGAVGLPDGPALDGKIAAMRTGREQRASDLRDEGYRQAMAIRAEGDARASKIYADAFGQDPEFYDFYRAMQSYRMTFAGEHPDGGSTQMVLSPDSEYFRQFRGGGKP